MSFVITLLLLLHINTGKTKSVSDVSTQQDDSMKNFSDAEEALAELN